jgi:LppX_LprAFG lipoprotein
MRRAAVALLVLPLALAACGGGKSSSGPKLTPVAYVKSAAQKTAAQTSEHVTLTGTAHVNGQAVQVSGNGDFDTASKSGSMHASVNVGGLAVPIDEVIAGSVIYMKSPVFSDGLPKGKTWIKVDLQRSLASKGIDFSALSAQSPSDTLAQMRGMGDVTVVGDETVGGTATTHYRGTIDLSKVPQGAQLKSLGNPTYGPYHVWIGKDDGLVRRVKFSFAIDVPKAGRETVAIDTDYSDFGKDVNVTVPTDAESVDATDAAIKGLGG